MARSSGTTFSAVIDPRKNKQLRKVLDNIDGHVKRRRWVAATLRRAFRPAYNTMRANAAKSERTGKLKRSITTSTFYNKSAGGYVVRLGPRYKGPENKRARHAHFVELGTRGGTRRTKKSGSRFTFPSGAGIVRTRKLKHKGTRAQPFVAPTRAKYAGQLEKRVMDTIAKEIAKYWNKKT